MAKKKKSYFEDFLVGSRQYNTKAEALRDISEGRAKGTIKTRKKYF